MKIAVIGSGISGMACAYALAGQVDLTVYEQADYIGGHSRTRWVKTPEGDVPVDTGFIVFNKKNYPLLTALFEAEQVPVVPSNMSFGVSIDSGRLEYGSTALERVFAQPANALSIRFWRMLKDILTFNSNAHHFLEGSSDLTLGECIEQLGLGSWFQHYYLLAMGACIWSMPLKDMLAFPASTFIRFFDNHGLLAVRNHPQWYTVKGGSRVYVEKLTRAFAPNIRLGCGVVEVVRQEKGVIVRDLRGGETVYDNVVFACHADQVLSMLTGASEPERRILGAFRYQSNRVVLHRDTKLMPKRRKAWSSWVYRCDGNVMNQPAVSLSYWMNNLQPLETSTQIFVTLNPAHEPEPDLVDDVAYLEHPIFDRAAIKAQSEIEQIQGRDRLWFCGAYQRYGFHEDGLSSAVKVAKGLGAPLPWVPKACLP